MKYHSHETTNPTIYNSQRVPELPRLFNSSIRRQAITRTNAHLLSFGPLGTNFGELRIKIQNVSFKKMHLKMSSVKWRPFRRGGGGGGGGDELMSETRYACCVVCSCVVPLLSQSDQHDGYWRPGAYQVPGHLQSSWWHRPIAMPERNGHRIPGKHLKY